MTVTYRYVDDAFLIVEKQSGLLSVPGRLPENHDSVALRVQKDYPDALIVHRLDMETSGLMVLARSREAHRNLSRQFHDRCVEKYYVARVMGLVIGDSGHIDLPVRCDWPNRPRQIVDHDLGKHAKTFWRVNSRETDATRLGLYPVTGRSHQLRVHMQAIGHPILGDRLYADENGRKRAKTLQLHAARLSFSHPETGNTMVFFSPIPF